MASPISVLLLGACRSGTSAAPRYFWTCFGGDAIQVLLSVPLLHDLLGDLAADRGDLALEVAHAGFLACSGG